MSKRQIIMLAGVWTMILAIPGFPYWLRAGLLVITGLGLVAFGYRMEPPALAEEEGDKPFSDYKRPENPAEPVEAEEAQTQPYQAPIAEQAQPQTPETVPEQIQESHEEAVG